MRIPKIVVGCVPEHEGRIPICRRAIEPRLGYWTFPAGFMENGETLEEGAARECREEALASVQIGSLLAVVNIPEAQQVHVFFRARLTTSAFGAGEESLEAKLVDAADIPWSDISFPSTRFALERYLADRSCAGGNAPPRRHSRAVSGLEYAAWVRGARMTFVVTENCIKCKYMDCVEVCPVDCFHEGPNFLVIDPDECIDCTLCEPECPAEAIFSEDEVPADQKDFLKINAELAKSWPVLTEKKPGPCRRQGMGRQAGQARAAGALIPSRLEVAAWRLCSRCGLLHDVLEQIRRLHVARDQLAAFQHHARRAGKPDV